MSFLSDSNEIAQQLHAKNEKRRTAEFTPPFILVRRDEVERGTGISRTTIYNMMNPESDYYDPTFPLPLRIGARSVAWRADELESWMKNLPRARTTDLISEAP